MSTNPLGRKAVECALRSVGVHEEGGDNHGKYVAQYLESVDLPEGNPWCAAFVFYKVRQAAEELGVDFSLRKTGSVQKMVDWAKENATLRRDPEVGNAIAIFFPKLNRYAHIGLITKVEKGPKFTTVETVEGNSNNDGSRNGNAVVKRRRKWNLTLMRAIEIK